MSATTEGFYRVCVKLYSPEPDVSSDADAFVPIFHEWIREQAVPDLMLFDVADYAHAPVSPGIMLVTHEISFALDRSDGEFGLLAQRRVRFEDGSTAADAVESTLRHVIRIAGMLERDERLAGKLDFDASSPRFEANDRLRLPNTDQGYAAFAPVVEEAAKRVYPGRAVEVERIQNDPRDRLSVRVKVDAEKDVAAYLAA